MNAHRIETALTENGKLSLQNLPFKKGDEVEIIILNYQSQGLGISIISCWEIAKLVEKRKLVLSIPVDEWLKVALAYPGVQLLNLTVPIVVESTQLIKSRLFFFWRKLYGSSTLG